MALVGMHSLHARGNTRALLDCAENARAKEPDRAMRFLDIYLVKNPSDNEARVEFAKLLRAGARTPADLRRLVPVLTKILELDSERADIRRELIDLDMRTGQLDDAIKHITILLQADPAEEKLQELLADCKCTKLGSEEDGAKAYETLLADHPDRIPVYVKLAAFLRNRLHLPARANHWMNKLVESNDKAFAAYVARARYRMEFAGADTAEKDVDEALRLAPNQPEVLLLAAEFAQSLPHKNGQQARRYLDQLLAIQPDARAYEMLAGLEVSSQRPQTAIRWLRQGLEKLPENTDLLWNLAYLLIQTVDASGARAAIGDLSKFALAPGRLAFLQAALDVQEGKWLKASKALENTRDQLKQEPKLLVQLDLLLARCYTDLGDPSRALLAYQQSVKREPLNPAGRLGLVNAHLELGQLDLALKECQSLTALSPPPPTSWVLLARLQLLDNLRLPAAQRHWEDVEKALEQAQETSLDSAEVTLLRAEMCLAQDDRMRARKLLRAARDQYPKEVAFRIALAELARLEKEPNPALEILDEAIRDIGDSVELRLTRAKIHMLAGDKDAVRALAEGLDQWPLKDRARLLAGLAHMEYQLGADSLARELCAMACVVLPTDLSIRLLSFDIAERSDDHDNMRDALKAIQQIEGFKGTLARYNEARLLIHEANSNNNKGLLYKARELLEEVGRIRPEWSRVPLALAQIDELEQEVGMAIKHYSDAVGRGDRQPAVTRRLVQLLFTRQRYREADLVLQYLSKESIREFKLDRLAAEIAVEVHKPQQALEHAAAAVNPDSKDPADQRWLGQIRWAAMNLKEAEFAFLKARDLAADDPDNWAALIIFLADTGETSKAKETLREAEKALAGRHAELALGQCWLAVAVSPSELAEAEKYFEGARRAKLDDATVLHQCAEFYLRANKLELAEKCLRDILELGDKADKAAKERARDLLPIVLVSMGNPAKVQEALRLVDAMKGKNALPALNFEALKSRALVLAVQPTRTSRKEAIEVLELIDNRKQPLSGEELFLLIQLYDQVGERNSIRGRMDRLLASAADSPRFPEYLAYNVRSILRGKQVEEWQMKEASRGLEELKKRQPNWLQTAELEARLLCTQGKREEAAHSLSEHVQQKEPRNWLEAAGLLEELGSYKGAEVLLRRYATQSKEAERVLILARYLGRHEQLGEGLRLCETAWASCSPDKVENVGYAAVAVAREGRASAAQCEQLERELRQALEKKPGSSGLLVCLADLADYRGQYDVAVQTYRQVLANNQNNVEALNNLAWLLSFRAGENEKAQALRLAKRALELQKVVVPEVLDTVALANLANDLTEEAITNLQQASDVMPIEPRTLAAIKFHLARAYHKLGKEKEAADYFNEAKNAGLVEGNLHPMERVAWDKLANLEK
jgi:predicted Zn-dependent protease